jgi:hypothetical protein
LSAPKPPNLQLVFGTPGPGVSDQEFDAWYDEHLDEILSIPGFHAAQRYRLESVVVDPSAFSEFRHVVIYEVDSDTARLMAAMSERELNTADSYSDRKDHDSSGPELPAWWHQVRFASFNAVPVGERHESPASTD